jgi:ABC-type transporter Mla subunit MlaD
MAGRTPRNNLLAGLFLLGSLGAGLVCVIWIARIWENLLTSRTEYVFRFNLQDGAAGLKSDSVVKVGGQPAGMVTAVSFQPPRGAMIGGQAPSADGSMMIYVTAQVRSDIPLFRNARAFLELPLLGSVSAINIPDVGGPRTGLSAEETARLGRLEVLDATLAPPSFLAQAGYGDQQRNELQNILKRGSQIGDQISELAGTMNEKLPGTLEGVDATVTNVRALSADVRRDYSEQWRERITMVLENVRVGSVTLNDAMAEGRKLVGSVQEGINANRPLLDKIFLNAAELTEKVNTELYGKVIVTLNDGQTAVKDVAEIMGRARQLVIEETPNIRRALADARLASDQLKLMLIEVRRNPWRLLYQPTRKEMSEELLYDTARSYAEAVGDLRAAGEAMEAMLAAQRAGTAATPGDQARITELAGEVQAALERYRASERKLYNFVVDGGKPETKAPAKP